MSSLRISMDKSTIYYDGCLDSTHQAVQAQYHFESGKLHVRYLGLPPPTKWMGAQDYQPLLEQIRKRINLWTNRFLSTARHLQLICYVLMSITNFWMSSFDYRRMPQGNRSPLFCILVSGHVLNPRKTKISWGVVCRPKSECELGLKPLKEANMVSCLKLTWRLTSLQPSLWDHWVQTNLFVKETSEQ